MVKIAVERNVRLALQDLNPRGKHVLLMVHGWPLSKEIFEYQYNILPQYGIRCISYDLRGYGASDKPYHGYSYNRMADDLYRVIQSINCRSLTLLGFSMGGAICCRYMARHRGYKVRNLILCGAAAPSFVKRESSPYGMDPAQVDRLILQAADDRPAMCDDFGKLCFANPVSDSLRTWFSGISYKAAGYATIQGLEHLRDEDLCEDLPKIKVNTMILHGVKDAVCPFPLAKEQKKLIPHAFVVPFENSSHCLFYEEKDQFNAFVSEFVTQG